MSSKHPFIQSRSSIVFLLLMCLALAVRGQSYVKEIYVSVDGSPALALGIESLDVSKMGRQEITTHRKADNSPAYDPSIPTPTLSDVAYGPHERQILDFWKAEADSPTPLVFVIHGGGWRGGSKERLHRFVDIQQLLDARISVVAINYRLIRHAEQLGIVPPVKAPLHDAARALQFVRSKADEWKMDRQRIGAAGGSAGACSSLWLAYHTDLADPNSKDLIARESTRLWCAAVTRPQTSLDPKQIKAWISNCEYGGHAFGKNNFAQFLADRERILPWIGEYSPYALVSADDPSVYLFYTNPPALGQDRKDPVHSSNFGVTLQERCAAVGIGCEVEYPGAVGVEHKTPTDYLIASLKGSAHSYLNSDGSRFVPRDAYPRFSWDTTPMYYMFGDTQRVLQPEEVEFIAARTDFLCIEKSHGRKQLGAAELGAKHEAAAFKKIKPEMKVLFYFNAARAWPFTSYSKNLRPETINDHPGLKKLLLVDPTTGELARQGSIYCFDVLNPDFRAWWVNTVAKGVADSGCDGAFIDQMHGYAWLRADKSEEVEKAMGQMMAALKEKMGPDKILLANNAHQKIAQHVFPVMDANMFEHYKGDLLSKESLLRDWDDMLRIAKAGKMSIFRIGVESDRNRGEQGDEPGGRLGRSARMAARARQRLEYYLACYLIGAQPYSYFQYGWGWTLSSGSLQDYPELHRPLGVPQGPYQRETPNGWEFTREFEHAHVWVDTEKNEAKITWREDLAVWK